jgi:hypothetical protein
MDQDLSLFSDVNRLFGLFPLLHQIMATSLFFVSTFNLHKNVMYFVTIEVEHQHPPQSLMTMVVSPGGPRRSL